jgi:hypothetical protein
MKRIVLLAVVGLALVLSAIDAQAADCVDTILLGRACTASNGVGWYYSAEDRAFFSTPAAFAVSAEPTLEYTFVPTCQANTPAGAGGICTTALCSTSAGEPGVSFWQFSRPIAPPGSTWSLQDTICVPGEQRVDLADIEAQVRQVIEDKFREIAEPSIQLAPQTVGLVNLPLLAWTQDRGDVRLEIEQPIPGVITGSPRYVWTWSNGSTAQGPGQPYDPGVSPLEDASSYVSSVYERRGEASVTLQVTWRAQVTVPGVAPVDLEPLVYTSTASLPVLEARSVLVDAAG